VPQPLLDNRTRGIRGNFYVSPDGHTLAFVRGAIVDDQGLAHDELVITSGETQGLKLVPWDSTNWVGLMGWLADSQRLLVAPVFDESLIPYERPDKVVVLNPWTGEHEQIDPSFPYSGEPLFDYWRSVGTSSYYDPTLLRVAYLDSEQTLVLWDRETSKELWRMSDPGIMSDTPSPVWSPNGSSMATVVRHLNPGGIPDDTTEFQLLSVGRNGETDSTDPFPYYAGLDHDLIHWSPDGRYLSFVWAAKGETKRRLLLWDTVAQRIIDYCIADPLSGSIWSPDSSQFVVQTSDKADIAVANGTFRNLIIDIKDGIVYSLDTVTAAPAAWIKSGP
jgi:WD40 repeat protein